MNIKRIDINADIVPNKGIGDIMLLDNAFSLRQLILSNTLSEQDIEWTFETEKQFPDWLTLNYKGILLVGVNIYLGKIISLTVRNGFKGKIFSKISIGSKVEDLMRIDNNFYYDESDEYILHKTDFNIRFDIDLKERINFTNADISNSKIKEITILNHKLSTTSISSTEFPLEWKE
ncbi:MAG: hypothetical protein WCI97_00590 [Bacteroidota bacterium]